MPLRILLRYLANEQVVDRLANSYIIRRLAQLTHYNYRRITAWSNEWLDKLAKESHTKEQMEGKPRTTGRLVSFTRNFMQNIQKEIEHKKRYK